MRRLLSILIFLSLAFLAGCELDTATDSGSNGDAPEAAEEELGEQPEETSPPPINLSGSGKSATERFSVVGGVTIFRMTHQGASNFAVQLLDGASGDLTDLLANDIGRYEGAKVVGVAAGEYVIDVDADGAWTIEIDQPRASAGSVSSPATGNGPSAIGPVEFPGGLATFTLNHSGSSNFAVQMLNNEGDLVELLANEIGGFNGTKAVGVDDGIYWFDVDADGAWTISW